MMKSDSYVIYRLLREPSGVNVLHFMHTEVFIGIAENENLHEKLRSIDFLGLRHVAERHRYKSIISKLILNPRVPPCAYNNIEGKTCAIDR